MAFRDLETIGEMFAELNGADRYAEALVIVSHIQRAKVGERKRQQKANLKADSDRYSRYLARARELWAQRPGFTKPRLRDDEARQIRELYARGVLVSDLAAHYGQSSTAIHDVIRGKSHSNAGGPIVARLRPCKAQGERHPHARLSAEQVAMIRESTKGCRELARELGVHHSTVSYVRRGLTWRAGSGSADA